jgi:hypothetical protein
MWYRQLSAGSNHAPQFARQAFHIGNKEDRENTHYGIEAAIRIAERRHIGEAELDVCKTTCRYLSASVVE